MSFPRVLIIDDHPLVSDGLQSLLSVEGIADTVNTFTSASAALTNGTPETADLALVDFGLPDMTGLQLISALRDSNPDLICVLMTGSPLTVSEREELAGFAGHFYHKGDPVEDLVEALKAPLPSPAADNAGSAERIAELTRRELELLALIGEGHELGEMANMLGISVGTARKHRENLMNKLDVRSSLRLMRLALQANITRPDAD
ncbi:response regulator transcription factor [Maricaulis sp.]|uniref:response regulator transcription factor n=1 Tax=Maricaulis sp. TaxID=1486257 RepID=UPI001B1B6930|nr:response regulator transcription factor [Maricaulis sp.]MBO6798477.1 response regulator transcription factor [Maricaulis sp.]